MRRSTTSRAPRARSKIWEKDYPEIFYWDGADELPEVDGRATADWDPANLVDNVKRPPITTKSFRDYHTETWGPPAYLTRWGGGRYGDFPLDEILKGMGIHAEPPW